MKYLITIMFIFSSIVKVNSQDFFIEINPDEVYVTEDSIIGNIRMTITNNTQEEFSILEKLFLVDTAFLAPYRLGMTFRLEGAKEDRTCEVLLNGLAGKQPEVLIKPNESGKVQAFFMGSCFYKKGTYILTFYKRARVAEGNSHFIYYCSNPVRLKIL